MPGGCELGPRPIDLHLAALKRLGAEIEQQGGSLLCHGGGRLRGAEIDLALPSVGATENAMLAACGAAGETVIRNAAREPEIVDLARFLRAMGASIRGEGAASSQWRAAERSTGVSTRSSATGLWPPPISRRRPPPGGMSGSPGWNRNSFPPSPACFGTRGPGWTAPRGSAHPLRRAADRQRRHPDLPLSRLSHRRPAGGDGRPVPRPGHHGVCGDHV